jgi:hypothetical protein
MNTSEKFKPSFSRYFIAHYNDSLSISFNDVSSYPDLNPKLQEFAEQNPSFNINQINKIEGVQYNKGLGLDLESNMLELQSLLDYSMKGLSPSGFDVEEGLIPLLMQLHGLRSKIDDMIDKVDKQKVFYEKDSKVQTSN